MLSRSPSSTRLRLEPFEDRLCLSINYGAIEFVYRPSDATGDAADVGTGDLTGDADTQETIAMGGYIRVKKLNSGG